MQKSNLVEGKFIFLVYIYPNLCTWVFVREKFMNLDLCMINTYYIVIDMIKNVLSTVYNVRHIW